MSYRAAARTAGLARVAVLGGLLLGGCTLLPPSARLDAATAPAAAAAFAFADDTFAFPNEIRSRNPGAEDLYANYCFVLARGLRQFHQFARFDPAAPRLDHDAYALRVRQVAARPPWGPALPLEARVVIPGYANLRDFSRDQERAVKAGLGSRFWTLVHWTNWRVTFPVSRGHQTVVAMEIAREVEAGRLVQLLVTNWPKPELNHAVVAFGYRRDGQGLDFAVWDPNDPDRPGRIRFDPATSAFHATRLFDTAPGPIRVFRMSHSPLL